MDWLSVLSLLIVGVALIIVEVIFVPGVTLVGILGFGLTTWGVWLAYQYFGNTTGHIVLIGTVGLGSLLLLIAFKSGFWSKMGLKQTLDIGGGDLTEQKKLIIGQNGKTLSALRPMGSVEFANGTFEVSSEGTFIAENTCVEIVRLEENKIFVKPC